MNNTKYKCVSGKTFNPGLCTIRYNAAKAKHKAGDETQNPCYVCETIHQYIVDKKNKQQKTNVESDNSKTKVKKVTKEHKISKDVKVITCNLPETMDIDINAIVDTKNQKKELIIKYEKMLDDVIQQNKFHEKQSKRLKEKEELIETFINDIKNLY